MKKLDHPNIIQFIDAKKTDNNIYLIMEYCNGGSLEELVKSKKGQMSNKTLNTARRVRARIRMNYSDRNVLRLGRERLVKGKAMALVVIEQGV